MIRRMKPGEEDEVRTLLARLSFEDQVFWRKQTTSFENHLEKSGRIPIQKEIEGKNAILVAEEEGMIVGVCWCTIVDRGIDKQAEIAEFYIKKKFRGKGIGKELLTAANCLFEDEQVEVAFVWTHHKNKAAVELYRDAGFKEVDQLVMAYVFRKDKA